MSRPTHGNLSRSIDCQWSRHILCLTPGTCDCPCHKSFATQHEDCDRQQPVGPVCIYSTEHGDCGEPAHYSLMAIADGHTAYSCEVHFTKTLMAFGDYEGNFDVRELKGIN